MQKHDIITHYLPNFYELVDQASAIAHKFSVDHGFPTSDIAHDLSHYQRVAANCIAIAPQGTNLYVTLIAVAFHDCANYPKDHLLRSESSKQASVEFLAWHTRTRVMPLTFVQVSEIQHAIEAHSFSAGITPVTLSAKVLSDADKLDALGPIGIARLFACSGAMDRILYDVEDPNATERPRDDKLYALDHLHTKLYRLGDMMYTPGGRSRAKERIEEMKAFEEDFLHQAKIPGPYQQPEFLRDVIADLEKNSPEKQDRIGALKLFGAPYEYSENGNPDGDYTLCEDVWVGFNVCSPDSKIFHLITRSSDDRDVILINVTRNPSVAVYRTAVWIALAQTYKTTIEEMESLLKSEPHNEEYMQALSGANMTVLDRWKAFGIKFDRPKEGILDCLMGRITQL